MPPIRPPTIKATSSELPPKGADAHVGPSITVPTGSSLKISLSMVMVLLVPAKCNVLRRNDYPAKKKKLVVSLMA